MRTKDELFRAAQREVAARRQRAVTRAEALRTEALRRHPEINPFLTREEMLQVLDIVGQAAYGQTPVSAKQTRFVEKAYLRTAKGVYKTLPWYQKIWFKWFWVAL